jgi:DNA replication protein DnaC
MKSLKDLMGRIPPDSYPGNSPTSSNASYSARYGDRYPGDEGGQDGLCPKCGLEAICGGLGYVRRDLPVDHPDFGKLLRCPQLPVDPVRREKLRSLGNLDAFREKSFETFQVNLPALTPVQIQSLQVALHVAQDYARSPDGWLLLEGTYGCGKTHLAAAIANARLEFEEAVLFITTPDLLDHLRSTFGPTSEVGYDELFDRVRNAPLLILDDLGAESPTPWAQEKLFQIINHRYLHRLNTVITTNVDVDRLDPRVCSRLLDPSITKSVKIDLPDFRRNENPYTQITLTNLSLYADMIFERFDFREDTLTDQERRNLRQAFEIALQFAAQPQGWLVFMGEHGCGKTFLAAAIANHRAAQGDVVMFVTAADLLDYLREAFNPTAGTTFSQRFQEIRSAPLLVIDELDITTASPWAVEKLRQIVNYRYRAQLPTVFTTTLELETLDPVLRSRLMDARFCHVFAILAPDYRGGQPPGPRRRSAR